jgi:CubicO group peptidase (beta-lactamase class C family)
LRFTVLELNWPAEGPASRRQDGDDLLPSQGMREARLSPAARLTLQQTAGWATIAAKEGITMGADDRPPAPQEMARPQAGEPVEALPPHSQVGKYEVVDTLGQGGFGITYRAHDAQLGRDVALKEYLPVSFARRQDGTTTVLPRSTHTAEEFLWGRERFLDEAKTLARLEGTTGIVNVHDYLEANGTAYMVMALVRGETLDARLRRSHRLPQPAIEQFLLPLLDGLEKVHEAGFLHRDIKPSNIVLDGEGRATLIDFGASRVALQGPVQAMTAVFTPGYAAFEQATSGKQGPWTDIYGLAATLYHCVSGSPPPSALDRAVEDTLVPAAEAARTRYAPSLLAAVDAGLALKPADRPRTIAEWRRILSGLASVPAATPPGPPTRRLDESLPDAPAAGARHRRLAGVWFAAAFVALAAGGSGVWIAFHEEDKGRAGAEAKRQAETVEAALKLGERDRRLVRVALKSLGFDSGDGSGPFGTRSRPMIAAWQASRGFLATGYLTGEQLAALRQQAAAAIARFEEEQRDREDGRRKAEQDLAARKAVEQKAAADAAAKRRAEEDGRKAAGDPGKQPSPVAVSFDGAMQAWMPAYGVRQASVAVMHHDRLAFAAGYGLRRAEDRVPVWGMSKAITGACIATFVQDGRLKFDDPIGAILSPVFAKYGRPADGRMESITVAQLLSHRSGLPRRYGDNFFAPGARQLLQQQPLGTASVDMLMPSIMKLSLVATPGVTHSYANVDYLLLGQIIEILAGRPYDAVCAERVLARAGIRDARLDPRWGRLLHAAAGWSLSGPEYLAFARLLSPRQHAVLTPQSQAWLRSMDDKWTSDRKTVAYTLGIYARRVDNAPPTLFHGGGWVWRQDAAAGGAISEKRSTWFVLGGDGIGWFASFDGLQFDTEPKPVNELRESLQRAARSISVWPTEDQFAAMGVGLIAAPR